MDIVLDTLSVGDILENRITSRMLHADGTPAPVSLYRIEEVHSDRIVVQHMAMIDCLGKPLKPVVIIEASLSWWKMAEA